MIARLALGWSLLLISQGTPSPLTAPELAAQLDGLASVIEAADATAAASVLPSVPVSEVVTAAGATYEIKFDWLRGGLREAGAGGPYWLSRRAALASRLRAMAHEARAAGADQGHPAGARQALTEVLTQKRFQRARTRSWMADLRRRFGQWLRLSRA